MPFDNERKGEEEDKKDEEKKKQEAGKKHIFDPQPLKEGELAE